MSKQMVITASMVAQDTRVVTSVDSILTLELSVRPRNALLRARIRTIGDLTTLLDAGEEYLFAVRNLGEKGIREIKESLANVTIEANPVDFESVTKAKYEVNVYADRLGQIRPGSPLAALGLNVRVYRALRRYGIETVEHLLHLRDKGDESIYQVRNLGDKGVSEVNLALERFEFVDTRVEQDEKSSNDSQIEFVYVISPEVIAWQADLVSRQIRMGTLHREAICQGHSIGHWLTVSHQETTDRMFLVFANILGGNLTICEELERLVPARSRNNRVPEREFNILIERNNPNGKKTLQEIAETLGITRERVRQLQQQALRSLLPLVSTDAATLRIQSALLFSRDLSEELTWTRWHRDLVDSGLCGRWRDEAKGQSPIELMLALCKAFGDKHEHLRIPENLQLAIKLKADGRHNTPVGGLLLKQTITKSLEKNIERHHRFCGGVDVFWLSREHNLPRNLLDQVLNAMEYKNIGLDWYSKPHCNVERSRFDVFHNTLNKAFYFCGPLTANDICVALQQAVSRTDFPIPPPKDMANLLQFHGYSLEDGLFFSEEVSHARLNNSETVIIDCIRLKGRVVHHTELVQAFIESDLTIASLHGCLNYSPLFAKIGKALYHLRGEKYSDTDVERAKAAAIKVEANLTVNYELNGALTVKANLSQMTIATGVFTSHSMNFPNMSGEWEIIVSGESFGTMTATKTEFRRLTKAFQSMRLKTGERVSFTFVTQMRKVVVSRQGEIV